VPSTVRRRIVARAATALGACCAVLLTGCSEVPRSGDAQLINRLSATAGTSDRPAQERARVIPELPADNAPPEEIVRGFLAAQAGASVEGLSTAGKYLRTASVWEPEADEDANVYAFVLDVTERRPASSVAGAAETVIVDVTFDLRARITPDGEYVPDVRTVQHTYELRGGAGQWRLTAVPTGLWVLVSSLDDAYRRVEPMFVTADQKRLVRDPVFLPTRKGSDVTAIVQRLMDGPTDRLRSSGVSTAFPVGTTLKSVPDMDGGTQVVNFGSELWRAQAPARSLIAAQLVWTLTTEVAGIEKVDIQIDGEDFIVTADDRGGPHDRDRWPGYAPDDGSSNRGLYFAHDNNLVHLTTPSDVREVRDIGSSLHPAVDRAESRVAVVRPVAGGAQLFVGPIEGKLEPSVKAKRVTDPSWGLGNEGVWTVSQNAGRPEAWLVPPEGGGKPAAPFAFTEPDRVLAFEVAPDGVQVAVITQRGARRTLHIGLIHRAPSGRAYALSRLRAIAPAHDVTQVAWVDGRSLAFIGRTGQAPFAVWRTAVDGSLVDELEGSSSKLLPARRGRERLLTRGDLVLIAVEPDVVYRYNGSTWELDAPTAVGP